MKILTFVLGGIMWSSNTLSSVLFCNLLILLFIMHKEELKGNITKWQDYSTLDNENKTFLLAAAVLCVSIFHVSIHYF